jgi:IstB-like ATP binding protein
MQFRNVFLTLPLSPRRNRSARTPRPRRPPSNARALWGRAAAKRRSGFSYSNSLEILENDQPVRNRFGAGVGKTFLACALGQQACRQGYRVLYRRVPRLFDELGLAHTDGSYPHVLARLARVDVLVLDDWGLTPLTEAQRQDLLEVLEDRDGTRSTILTSHLPREQWHAYLGKPTVADAILDRVVHRAVTITLTGPSRRKDPPRPENREA